MQKDRFLAGTGLCRVVEFVFMSYLVLDLILGLILILDAANVEGKNMMLGEMVSCMQVRIGSSAYVSIPPRLCLFERTSWRNCGSPQ